MSEPIVSITDVEPEAVRIPRTELKAGDFVFDVYGGRHEVKRSRNFKAHTTAVRTDGAVFVLAGDETITVIKGES